MRVDYVVVAGNRLITVHGRDNGSVVGREERREERGREIDVEGELVSRKSEGIGM